MNWNRRIYMKEILRYLAAAAMLALMTACGRGAESEEFVQDAVVEQNRNVLGFCPDSLECVEGKVKNGQFFSTLMMGLGLDANQAYALTQACDTTFDVRSLRVGNRYKAYYDSGVLQYVVYTSDRVNELVFKCTEPYQVSLSTKPVTIEKKYADVTINSSLWVDMRAAGVSPFLVLDLSDIYAWTVDFFGLQKGDRFRVLYDEKVCDGETIAIDTVRYAVFSHAGRDLPMIMFNQKDGGNIWWDENGASMRKAFLKAPLKFSRISSGFSYARKHPVTKKVRPHTGVDYAAPTGTPVMTIGDGVVTSVKYEGAGGKTIRIRHNSVYSTAYLHLSKYAKGIKAGARVRQGEVIGYVGSTGRSTGPHLDFRVWKNGSPINPLKMESPPAEPIRKESRQAFENSYSEYRATVDTIRAGAYVERLMRLL
jgi:murein DD-endopeptidase MepM/ murein hydrolase activator NlpD